jgi:hypothetical protein
VSQKILVNFSFLGTIKQRLMEFGGGLPLCVSNILLKGARDIVKHTVRNLRYLVLRNYHILSVILSLYLICFKPSWTTVGLCFLLLEQRQNSLRKNSYYQPQSQELTVWKVPLEICEKSHKSFFSFHSYHLSSRKIYWYFKCRAFVWCFWCKNLPALNIELIRVFSDLKRDSGLQLINSAESVFKNGGRMKKSGKSRSLTGVAYDFLSAKEPSQINSSRSVLNYF